MDVHSIPALTYMCYCGERMYQVSLTPFYVAGRSECLFHLDVFMVTFNFSLYIVSHHL